MRTGKVPSGNRGVLAPGEKATAFCPIRNPEFNSHLLEIVPVAKPSKGNRDTFFQLEKGNRRLGRICRHCWPNDCGCYL